MIALVLLGLVGFGIARSHDMAKTQKSSIPVDWAPSPEQTAAYWARMATGKNPALAGTHGTGTTSPMTSTLNPGGFSPRSRLPRAVGAGTSWAGPRAGTTNQINHTKPGGPPGFSPRPLPVSPAQPTQQSAVQRQTASAARGINFRIMPTSRWIAPKTIPLHALTPATYPLFASGFVAVTVDDSDSPEKA